jgi:hypothetical protein
LRHDPAAKPARDRHREPRGAEDASGERTRGAIGAAASALRCAVQS